MFLFDNRFSALEVAGFVATYKLLHEVLMIHTDEQEWMLVAGVAIGAIAVSGFLRIAMGKD